MKKPALSSAWSWLSVGIHLLMSALLAVTVAGAFDTQGGRRTAVLALSSLVALLYVAGLSARVRHRPRLAWVAALTLAVVALMVLTPQAIWLAFPMFFLLAHSLGDRIGATAVGGLTIVAILAFGWHEHTFAVGTVLGPTLGAIVAVLTVAGIRVVRRESERRGVLEERERLAREIHDTLTQGLSSIHLLLGAAEPALPDGEPAALVRRAQQVAKDNLEESRRFVRALSPADLADASLAAALRRLAERSSTSVLTATVEVSGTPTAVPTSYDAALLRIAQGALANAVSHARARRVTLTLSYMDEQVALDVVDDGVGFDPSAVPSREGGRGFGLSAMRARAEQLGGRLAVESAAGQGTAVAVAFPLVHPAGAR